jgi:hypothetical protein
MGGATLPDYQIRRRITQSRWSSGVPSTVNFIFLFYLIVINEKDDCNMFEKIKQT